MKGPRAARWAPEMKYMASTHIMMRKNRRPRGSSIPYSHLDRVEKTGNLPRSPGTYRDRLIINRINRPHMTATVIAISASVESDTDRHVIPYSSHILSNIGLCSWVGSSRL